MAPEDKITSRPRNSCCFPSTIAETPTHRRPSNSSWVTDVRVEISKFGRFRTSAFKYPIAAETRFSLALEIVIGK